MYEMSLEEVEARRFFKALGLVVQRVSESSSKTPEFLVDGDEFGYVVKVKSRFDEEEYKKNFRAGKIAFKIRSTGYDRWTEDIARYAIKQMESIDPNQSRFWILWISVECQAARDTMFDQIVGSLFGIRQICYWDRSIPGYALRGCLLVVPGVFEQYPEIQGVVISQGNSLGFCVNESSNKFNYFKNSRIYTAFESKGQPTSANDLTESRIS